MKRSMLLVVIIAAFLASSGVATSERLPLGPLSTTGYTTGFEFEPLPNGYLKFHLTAQGGAETPADDFLCTAMYGQPCQAVCTAFLGAPCGTDGYLDGAFAFDEWGVVDPLSGYGANFGLMTLFTDSGQAQIRFDGQTDGVAVGGSFAVLDGNDGYKNLKGQGTFAGNAGFVFTVAYEACGKHTGVDCPNGGCMVGGSAMRFGGNEVRWPLTNYGPEALTIDSLTVFWPEGNGRLDQVRLGGKIYQTPMEPAWGVVESGWLGAAKDRQINPGQTKELTFRFANAVSSQPSHYTILVKFVEGCAATAVAFPSP